MRRHVVTTHRDGLTFAYRYTLDQDTDAIAKSLADLVQDESSPWTRDDADEIAVAIGCQFGRATLIAAERAIVEAIG